MSDWDVLVPGDARDKYYEGRVNHDAKLPKRRAPPATTPSDFFEED
jgi:hypothetical protein